jgi:hypothetical protein
MSGVVLRCPNCGTTQAVPGECEACHEAQVRYFCTNHTPGHWLEAPTCPQCGARFGDPGRPRAAPAPAPARTPAPASAPPAGPWGTASTAGRRKAGSGPWGRRKRSPSIEEGLEAPAERAAARDRLMARLPELVRAATRFRRTPVRATPVPGPPPTGLAVGGCLIRALFFAVFLLIAFLTMSIIVGGSLLQLFGAYY